MIKSIPDMYLPGTYRDETVSLKSCKYTFKNYDLGEYVEFGAT